MKSIVYNSYGVWRIFSQNGFIKVYSPITLDDEILIESNYNFSVACDDKDNIFIICQENSGDIYFITINGEKTEKNFLLESKIKQGYEKYFTLTYVNGWLNAVYILNRDEHKVIIHHVINSSNKPEIVDEMDNTSPLFTLKSEDNLIIYYQKSDKIIRKKFIWNEKLWQDEEIICDEESPCQCFNAYISENISCLVYTVKRKEKFHSVFVSEGIKFDLIKNSFSVIVPVIAVEKGNIHILFEYGGRILESLGIEGKSGLSRPKYSYYGTFEKADPVEISSPLTEKIYTYGFETPKGAFRPLVIENIKVEKKEKISKPVPEVNEKPKEETKKDDLKEILKMLDNKNEMQILSDITKRLSDIESILKGLSENKQTSDNEEEDNGN